MTISKASSGEEGARGISNSLKDIIGSNKGKVLNSSFLGKRKFAYKVNTDTEGYYEVIDFEMEPNKMPKFKSKLNLTDSLLRYLVIAQ